jgi:hypothetical protein
MAKREDKTKAIRRAKSVIKTLEAQIKILAREDLPEDFAERAIQRINRAYQGTHLDGESFQRNAAMELVSDIRLAAKDVLEGLMKLEDAECRLSIEARVAEAGGKVDNDAFRTAVRAWVESELATVRRRRPPDRWGPTYKCLKSSGITDGIGSAASLKTTWRDARPNAVPLVD